MAALGFTFVAEFGDKTQLAIVALCARHDRSAVLAGSLLAFAVVDGLTVLIGDILASVLPFGLIHGAAGLVFVALGVYLLLSRGEEDIKLRGDRFAVVSSFATISMMELGDKTQLAVVTLAARLGHAMEVFFGVMAAFSILTVLAVSVGKLLKDRIPRRNLEVASGVLFIAFGLLSLANLLTGSGLP